MPTRPVFFDNEQYKAFIALLGEPGAKSLDDKLDVLVSSGGQGGRVSAESYGAKGDGTTDCSAALAAAIADVGEKGVVTLGRGTFVVQNVTLKPGIIIQGAGIGVTVLKLPASPTASTPMFKIDATSVYDGGGFRDCEFDGGQYSALAGSRPTAASGNSLTCIDLSAATSTIDGFTIRDCYIHHFDTGVQASPLLSASTTFLCRTFSMWNTRVWYCNVGLYAQEHPELHGCYFWYNNYGVTGRLQDAYIIGCHFTLNKYGCTPQDGVTVTASSKLINSCRFVGCTFYKNDAVGLELSNANMVIGCQFIGESTDIVGTYDYTSPGCVGINVSGERNRIIGNQFGGGTADTSFYYAAISLDNEAAIQCYGTLIQGNVFTLSACAAIMCRKSTSVPGGNGALGSFNNMQIVDNYFYLLGGVRAIDGRTNNGSIRESTIANNYTYITTGTLASGLFDIPGYRCSIRGNYFYNNGGTVTNAIKIISISASCLCDISNNYILGTYTAGINLAYASDTWDYVRNNVGTLTEATGVVAMNDGATTATVTHGLASTPLLRTMRVNLLGLTLGPTTFKVGTVTSTQFTITGNTAVTGGATVGAGSSANLTITSHGLQTGDPFVWTGGTVAATTPSTLAIGTVYYARMIDANTVQVHTTQIGATGNTGNFTNLSGSGGTMGIVLGWNASIAP